MEECLPCVRFAGVYFRVAFGMGSSIKNHTVCPVEEKREDNYIQNIRCFSKSRINFLICCFPALYFHAN